MTDRPPAPAALLALCVALAGCGGLAGPSEPQVARFGAPERVLPVVEEGACGGAGAAVGAHFTTLADLDLPGELRVLWPGQQVTDELRPTRLNAQVSDSGTIRRVFCG